MKICIHKIKIFSALAFSLTLITPLFAFTGKAQERAQSSHRDLLCVVQFPINISDYDSDYKSNRRAIPTTREYFDAVNITKIDSEIIVGATSPEGTKNPDSSTVTQTIIQSSEFMVNDTLPVSWEEPKKPVKYQKPLFALKTNLLYDAATIINVSLEVPIGTHWSIAGEFIFPWWLNEKKQNTLQVYNGNLEVKYWFGPRENQKKGKFSTMTGWFIGVYGGGAVYDIEYKGKGYQGESLFSTGLMGGYAHSIGKCLRMEYSLGIGYMQTRYRYYESKFSTIDNQFGLYRQNSGNAKWIGPTHVKISLVWMLGRNVKKGGTK